MVNFSNPSINEYSLNNINANPIQVNGQLNVVTTKADELKMHQARVQDWIDKHGKEFIAHAVWTGNFTTLVKQGGNIKAAEAILREEGIVECEIGNKYEARAVLKMIKLTEEDIQTLEVLDEDKQQELDFLLTKRKTSLSQEEYKELKQLYKKIKMEGSKRIPEQELEGIMSPDILLNAEKERELKGATELIEKRDRLGKEALNHSEKSRYEELLEKGGLSLKEHQRIRDLEQLKLGWEFRFEGAIKKRVFFEFNYVRLTALVNLAKKYKVNMSVINIAHDQYRQNPLYKHLTHKFEIWTAKGMDAKLILGLLQEVCKSLFRNGEKLLNTISTVRNRIAWAYGNIALCRGNPDEIIGYNSSTKIGMGPNEIEHRTLAPFQNKGEFFRLPLAQKETIVIGDKNEMEPVKDLLDKMGCIYAYTQNLSVEQQAFFKIKNV